MKSYGNYYNSHDAEISAQMRLDYDTAVIRGALARGEIVRTDLERIQILASRYRDHKAHGRIQAAMACKKNAQRIKDRMKKSEVEDCN